MEPTAAAKIMVYLRLLLAIISLVAVYLMLKYPTVEAGLRINAVLSLTNPTILLLINLVGISGLAGKVSFMKLGFIIVGAIFIMLGTMK
ncbi:DUF2619 domain-containing protein [Desulforamulus ferrireducens]|uniref:DUF2619 domain-containing protein n=1 Tax=Desulforamulus ferrireducens TaxID=1833852 RepID=A0A1S6ITU2_9FIRM|nr:DUF2619 domain-containing protein [Desulforamulus ferrireducens]AQS58199.1 hypothetical protein B0537_03265 [Desulforamulus ferrireducens]